MKASSGFWSWRPIVGVTVIGGIAACCLAFRTAQAGEGTGGSVARPANGPAVNEGRVMDELQMFPPNYAISVEKLGLSPDEIRVLRSTTASGRKPGGAVAGPVTCSRPFECDDCLPCTEDDCSLGTCTGGTRAGRPCSFFGDCPPEGVGVCTFFGGDVAPADGFSDDPTMRECVVAAVSNGEVGECDNGQQCTQGGLQEAESCQGGACTTATPTCAAGEVCDPFNLGAAGLGRCRPTCTVDNPEGATGCTDGLWCNGIERCDTNGAVTGISGLCYTQGYCQGSGTPGPLLDDGAPCFRSSQCDSNLCSASPCGAGSPCNEPASTGFSACQTAFGIGNLVDANPTATLTNVCCGYGRCCTGSTCSRTAERNCGSPSLWLGTGDVQSTTAVDDAANCNVTGLEHTTPGLDVSCPDYSSGIMPRGIFSLDNDPATAAAAPPRFFPGVACYNNIEIGDDFTLNIPNGEFYAVNTIRYVLGVVNLPQSGGRMRITFYDSQGRFIEDIITGGTAFGTGVRTTIINSITGQDPEIVVPKTGFVGISAAINFDDQVQFNWLTTDNNTGTNAVDVGFNDETVIWYNGGSTPALSVLPPGISGVLAFELAGEITAAPYGACCNVSTGACDFKLKWICQNEGNVFQGIGTLCQACSGDNFTSCDDNGDCVTCHGGTQNNQPCNTGPLVTACTNGGGNCPGGTCLAFLPACTITACCNPTTGACTEISGGICCPGRCGGTGGGALCDSDANCSPGVQCIGVCTGPGTPCLNDAQCPAADDCVAQCTGPSVGQGFGSTCDPNCCVKPLGLYSGADNCENASVHLITLNPDPNIATTVTITGDNSNASFPDSCAAIQPFRPGVNQDPSDPGWWEAFTINGPCANVRVDFCCSRPIKEPAWAFLALDCPCSGATVGNATVIPPVGVLEDNNSRGDPFCDDDNLWQTFGPVPGDRTYYYPVYSDVNGAIGQYQLHVSAAACPSRACCLLEATCVNDITGALGVPCPSGQSDCVNGVTTCSLCTELNFLDCRAASGYWLGEGNIPVGQAPVVDCVGANCDIGSCCTAPGTCRDNAVPPVPCNPSNPVTCMDRALCGSIGAPRFVGGALCNFPTPPCPFCEFEAGDNCQPGGKIPPGSTTLGWTGFGTPADRSKSLKSPDGSAMYAADDFIARDSPLRRVCVQGFYVDDDTAAQNDDCSEQVAHNFLVRIYDNDPATNRPGTLVASRFGRVQSKGKEIENILDQATTDPVDVWRMQLELMDSQSPTTPLAINLNQGNCYWIEVTDDPTATTPDVAEKCDFYWTTRNSNGNARDGNDYFASRYGNSDWYTGPVDLAMCLDISFDAGGCGDVDGACCTGTCSAAEGSVAACATATQLACDASDPKSFWESADDCLDTCPGGTSKGDVCQSLGTADSCPGAGPNDGVCVGGASHGAACDSAAGCPGGGCNCNPNGPILITTVQDPDSPAYERAVVEFETNCALTDGPNPTRSELGGAPPALTNDVWYQYESTCNGRLIISTCGTLIGAGNAGGWDAFVAVYHNTANRTSCACPTAGTNNSLLWPNGPFGVAFDESCQAFAVAGPGLARSTTAVAVGDCFLIRVGGFETDTGTGVLEIACEESDCLIADPPQLAQFDSNANPPVTLADLKMNRYLGIRAPGSAGKQQAIRVEFRTLPPPFNIWQGQKLYVQDPVQRCETSGSDSMTTCTNPFFQQATLGCSLFYRDWTTVPGGTVYATHPAVIPKKTTAQPLPGVVATEYVIDVIDNSCLIQQVNFSVPVSVLQAKYGDMAGLYDPSGPYYATPEGENVGVGTDVTSILNKFGNRPGAPIKARADLEPCKLDHKINISDVNEGLNGFRNLNYRFAPGSGNCLSTNVCDYAAPLEVAEGQ